MVLLHMFLSIVYIIEPMTFITCLKITTTVTVVSVDFVQFDPLVAMITLLRVIFHD